MANEQKYQLERIKTLDHEELSSFCILYAPLLTPLAFQFYLLMHSLLDTHGKIKNNRFLCQTLRCTPLELTQARIQLEQFLLLQTFESEDGKSLILLLRPVKRGYKFLSHEILGRVYLKNMGTQMTQFAQLCFKDTSCVPENYHEISAPFKTSALDQWNEEEEDRYQQFIEKKDKPVKKSFDMKKFTASCSLLIFPENQRTKKNLQIIQDMGDFYKISMKDMKEFVGKATPYPELIFNEYRFRELIRDRYLPLQKEVTNIYEAHPLRFLEIKQKGVKPSRADAKLIEDLVNEMKLPPIVVNVLIEHILNTKDNRLDRSYVEKIASVWVRNQVDTFDKAVNACSEEKTVVTKKKVSSKTTRQIPQWYNEKEESFEKASDAEVEALLKQLEGK